MLICIAGPVNAPTEAERQENLRILNAAAARVYEKGHIPVIGYTAAEGVSGFFPADERYEVIMRISLAMADKCDAVLYLKESPGARREMELLHAKGATVYSTIEEIPIIPLHERI
jgi:hypothetical protein